MLTCPVFTMASERTRAPIVFLHPGQSRRQRGGIFQAASRPKFSYNLVTSTSWRRNVGSRRVISVAEILWLKNTVEFCKQAEATETFSLRKVSVSESVTSQAGFGQYSPQTWADSLKQTSRGIQCRLSPLFWCLYTVIVSSVRLTLLLL